MKNTALLLVLCVALNLLAGCADKANVNFPTSSPTEYPTTIPTDPPVAPPAESTTGPEIENNQPSLENGLEQKENGRQYTRTVGIYETQDWSNYFSLPGSEQISYTFILPDDYILSSSVVYIDNVKVGEFGPPVRLKEDQRMPESLDDICRDMDDDRNGRYYDSEMIIREGVRIFLSRSIVYPDGPGDIDVWYPHTFYTQIDDIIFYVSFYPLVKYPDPELFDVYLNVVSSIEIV